jgi:hypothetical protein
MLVLSGCSGSSAKGGAIKAVESYYQAIAGQDAQQLNNVTCAAFLETAQVEYDSFAGVKTELQDLSCQDAGKEGDSSLVKCTGKVVATYISEKMEFPIDDRVHKVQEQNGSWKVCGY